MAIITISHGKCCHGQRIAELVAERLGYECLGNEVLTETAQRTGISEDTLTEAIHDPPSLRDRLTHEHEKHLAHLRADLLEHLQGGDVVYHGLAGHFLVANTPQLLKVRVFADLELRSALTAQREGVPERRALHELRKDDRQRRRWSLYRFGTDPYDLMLYHLMLNVRTISVADATELICEAAQDVEQRVTPAAEQAFADEVLAARVTSALIELEAQVEVACSEGKVWVGIPETKLPVSSLVHALEKKAKEVPGARRVEIVAQ